MTHKIDDGITECGTSAPRKIARTFGKCQLCPDWRNPQELINGLCVDHRIWLEPRRHNGQGEPQPQRE